MVFFVRIFFLPKFCFDGVCLHLIITMCSRSAVNRNRLCLVWSVFKELRVIIKLRSISVFTRDKCGQEVLDSYNLQNVAQILLDEIMLLSRILRLISFTRLHENEISRVIKFTIESKERSHLYDTAELRRTMVIYLIIDLKPLDLYFIVRQ